METTMNNIHPDTTVPAGETQQNSVASRPAGRPDDDVVRLREFRLTQWVGGLALTAILSGQGFLFSAIMDLQRDTQTQINELHVDMHTQFGELRERIVRIETRLDLAARPADKGT